MREEGTSRLWDLRKKWLKICKLTSARSVTHGGWKPRGRERQCVVGTRTSRVSSAPSSSLAVRIEDVFYASRSLCFAREVLSARRGERSSSVENQHQIFVSSSEDKHGDKISVRSVESGIYPVLCPVQFSPGHTYSRKLILFSFTLTEYSQLIVYRVAICPFSPDTVLFSPSSFLGRPGVFFECVRNNCECSEFKV